MQRKPIRQVAGHVCMTLPTNDEFTQLIYSNAIERHTKQCTTSDFNCSKACACCRTVHRIAANSGEQTKSGDSTIKIWTRFWLNVLKVAIKSQQPVKVAGFGPNMANLDKNRQNFNIFVSGVGPEIPSRCISCDKISLHSYYTRKKK